MTAAQVQPPDLLSKSAALLSALAALAVRSTRVQTKAPRPSLQPLLGGSCGPLSGPRQDITSLSALGLRKVLTFDFSRETRASSSSLG